MTAASSNTPFTQPKLPSVAGVEDVIWDACDANEILAHDNYQHPAQGFDFGGSSTDTFKLLAWDFSTYGSYVSSVCRKNGLGGCCLLACCFRRMALKSHYGFS
jgi:hypothetical protein